MKNIISLLFVSVTILGFIIYFIMSKMVQSDTVLKSFQLPQKIPASKSLFAQSERAFPLPPELKDYKVIAENNLFRPLGWKREVQLQEESTPTVVPEPIIEIPPPPPTYTLVLTGIAKSDLDWIAVVEDHKQDEGTFLRRGEMLKDVRVQDIVSEHITLTRGEMTVQLALGESINTEQMGDYNSIPLVQRKYQSFPTKRRSFREQREIVVITMNKVLLNGCEREEERN